MARFDKLELNKPAQAGPLRLKGDADDVNWLKKADQQRRAGEYEDALRFYSRALEDDKTLIVGWLGQVQMLVQLGELKEAEMWARKALELFPNNPELFAGRAQALCRQAESEAALAAIDGAFKQPGQSAYRWTVRGEIMLDSGLDPARHCFDKGVMTDADWLVPLEIARIYLFHNQTAPALIRSKQALDKAADQPLVWFIYGSTQMELGLRKEAQQSLQRCLQLCPKHGEARQRLIQLAKGGGSLKRFWRRLFG